jgi:tetratricopeptide (TPR) repeat protein
VKYDHCVDPQWTLSVMTTHLHITQRPRPTPAWTRPLATLALLIACIAGPLAAQAADSQPPRVATEQAEALKKEELGVVRQLARDFSSSFEPIVLLGSVLFRHGQTAEALAIWEKVLQRDPNRPRVHEDMGWFEMQKGHYEQAIAHWQKVLAIDPRTPNIYSGIARALMGLNRHGEAIEALQKEIDISPESSFSYFLLGQEYLQQKQYEQAKAAYEKAIALQPDMTNAYYGLFNVCARLGQRDKAREHMATFKKLKADDMKVLKDRNDAFNDLIDMRQDAAETFLKAAQAYQAAGKLPRAEQLLKRATQLHPQDGTYHLHYGALAMQMGNLPAAEQAFRKVIELAPQSSRGYSGLAHLYLQVNRKLPEARQLAEEAVKREPSAFNFYVLSWARDRNGDRPGARAAIKRALQLEPDNQRFRRIAEVMEQKK